MVRQSENKTDLSWQQVYTSDILLLKQFFNALNGKGNNDPVGEDFGIPFMMAKRGGKITAFASFILDEGIAGLSFHQKDTADTSIISEQKSLLLKEASFHPYLSLKGNVLLQSNMSRFIEWLNKVN